jgi:ketosteroid isomerase-like protein
LISKSPRGPFGEPLTFLRLAVEKSCAECPLWGANSHQRVGEDMPSPFLSLPALIPALPLSNNDFRQPNRLWNFSIPAVSSLYIKRSRRLLMRKTLLVTALFMAAAMPVFAQTTAKPEQNNSVEQAVLKLTQEWLEAEDRIDRAALNRIIADDFLGTGPMGTTLSKTDVIPREGSGGHGLAISGQDLKVRVFGDTAIVTGRGVPKVQDRPELRITVVFVKRADRWQMVAGHLSTVPPNSD